MTRISTAGTWWTALPESGGGRGVGGGEPGAPGRSASEIGHAYAARPTVLSSPSGEASSSLLDEGGCEDASRASKWARSARGREYSSLVAHQSVPEMHCRRAHLDTLGASARRCYRMAHLGSYLDPAVGPVLDVTQQSSAAPSPEILLRMPSNFKTLSLTKKMAF